MRCFNCQLDAANNDTVEFNRKPRLFIPILQNLTSHECFRVPDCVRTRNRQEPGPFGIGGVVEHIVDVFELEMVGG